MNKVLILVRVALYTILLAIILLFSWNSCGKDMWSSHVMSAIEGILIKAENNKHPPFSKPGSSIEVEFRYSYNNQSYIGRNLTFCSSLSSGSMIDPLYEMYQELLPKVGHSITIWVNPANPEDSVVYKHTPRAAILIMCTALFVCFFGIRKLDLYLVNFWKKQWKD